MLAAQIVVIETYKAYMTHSDLIKDQLTQGPTALMSQTFSWHASIIQPTILCRTLKLFTPPKKHHPRMQVPSYQPNLN